MEGAEGASVGCRELLDVPKDTQPIHVPSYRLRENAGVSDKWSTGKSSYLIMECGCASTGQVLSSD